MSELLRVVPRFVDRTRRQAAFARSVVAMLPCLSQVAPPAAPDAPGPGEPEGVDVLSVMSTPPAAPRPEPVEPATVEPATVETPAPEESELGVQDYDSLAASQVVPRLVTLSPEELRAIQRYEQANRHRQTILNRVAALLDA